jgi:hypothetical protein
LVASTMLSCLGIFLA